MKVYEAAIFASNAHGSQLYGDKPYSYHLHQVAKLVEQRGNGESYIVVAYGHDLCEDCDISGEDLLYEGFHGFQVEAILALSKRPGEDYLHYIERVRQNPIALEVKKCDTMCNLNQSFKEGNAKRILKYAKQLQLLEAK